MNSISHVLKKLRVTNHDFKLSDYCTRLNITSEIDAPSLEDILESDIENVSKLQNILFAEDRQSLLIMLQGMDSSGKDGTIKHIMKGVNPQGVGVVSFKHPSKQELEHDYLWRHTIKLPEHGQILIFNRSYYENVLISKVHPELLMAERLYAYNSLSKIDKAFWKLRYNQIKLFEKRNIENGTQILKFFLHLSKDEQAKRFIDRISNQNKHWKFSSDDIEERKYWNEYQDAYELAIKRTSTKIAPWYVIPADDKPLAHTLIGKIILEKLQSMKPCFPPKTKKEQVYMQNAKLHLENELS